MEEIEYIANFLGIDLSIKYALKEIALIEDKAAFIDFMHVNVNHMSLEYKNALQRLSVLKKLFFLEVNAHRFNKAMSQAALIAKKFSDVKSLIKQELACDKEITLEMLFLEGKPYFSSFELRALNTLGPIRYLIRTDDAHQLEALLQKSFDAHIYLSTNPLPEKVGVPKTLLSVRKF